MEYELPCIATIVEPFYVILFALFVFAPLILFFKIKSYSRYFVIFCPFFVGGLLSTIPFFCFMYGGYGYACVDDYIEIKSYPFKHRIKLSEAEIILTESDEWRAAWRLFGVASPEYAVGKFRLKNEAEAVLFRHKSSDKFIVINASGKYYVLIHLRVEKLCEVIASKNTSCLCLCFHTKSRFTQRRSYRNQENDGASKHTLHKNQ